MKLHRGFSKEFDPCIKQVVNATLNMYKQSLLNLLPTPAKSHYLFNLRDFSRVIQVTKKVISPRLLKFFYNNVLQQGVLLSVPETMLSLADMKRLWVHEVLRVFGDRLVEQDDIDWLIGQIGTCLKESMDVDMDVLFSDLMEGENPVRIFKFDEKKIEN